MYPVAAPVVVVAIGKSGAEYLYTLALQKSFTNVDEILAGADGGFNFGTENLTDR
jgi:hypothetical protein